MAGKSVLVVDTPKTCKECPCQMMLVCVPANEDIDEYVDPNTTIPEWCPLKPLPQKLKLRIQREWITDYDRYEIGYNACLDKIAGETE